MTQQAYTPKYQALSSILHINGLNLEVLHWPQTQKPKLLLLHGWMDCAASFQAVVDGLTGRYDVYALSWRGFGASQWQHQGYYERMVLLQDLHQLLQQLSPQQPIHLCGHSMGSMLATHYAGLFPHRVKSLVMAEGFGMPIQDDAAAIQARMRRFIETCQPQASLALPSLAQLTLKLRRRNPKMSPELALFMAQALTHEQQGQLHYRADPKHHLPQAHPYDWHRIAPLWRQLSMPVLWLQGENLAHNHYLNRVATLLPERQQLLPKAQIITLPGAGHMLQWEAPQAFADALHKFLHQVEIESVQ